MPAYEVQLGLAGLPPFMSKTADTTSAIVADLKPDTAYDLATRACYLIDEDHHWSNLTETITCRTVPLLDGQAHVLPPTDPPTPTSIHVQLAPWPSPLRAPNSAAAFQLQYRPVGSDTWYSTPFFQGAKTSITGLSPATFYEVRASALQGTAGVGKLSTGPASDIVTFRTQQPGVKNLTMYRISELCSDAPGSYSYEEEMRPCQPDYLANHDTGALEADVEFITVASGGSWFVPDFNTSVTTRYCVAHAEAPTPSGYADYVSCNGWPASNYSCTCNVWLDRCIGRLDTSSCAMKGHGSRQYPECSCTEESTKTSARFVGKMPVYFPFPDGSRRHVKPPTCDVAPMANSTLLGDWYSMPAPSRCDPTAELPLAQLSAGGEAAEAACTWARRPAQHFVHGHELVGFGFNLSQPISEAQLEQNAAAIRSALARYQARCCEC